MTQLLPWQTALWARIADGIFTGQLSHAHLLSGPAGMGKAQFARHLSAALLCKQPSPGGEPCGQCGSCHLFEVNTHPDIMWLAPEEEGKQIPVDQIRALPAFLSLMPQHGRARVVVIEQAHMMNNFAANGLLKSLEEPPPHGKYLLLTHKLSALLPTLRSRCQRIDFTPPTRDIAKSWLRQHAIEGELDVALALSDGAPLRALQWLQGDAWQRRAQMCQEFSQAVSGTRDVITVAEKWAKSGADEALVWLESWLSDIVRCKLAQDIGRWRNPDLAAELTRLADGVETRAVYHALDLVQLGLRRLATSINAQMLLEEILLQCVAMRDAQQRVARV